MSLPSYRLHVTLRNVEPPVRRLIRVPGDLSLAELDLVLRTALDWEEGGPYRFEIDGEVIGPATATDAAEPLLHDARHIGLADFDPPAGFGFRWDAGPDAGRRHDVRVDDVLIPTAGDLEPSPPRCLDGEGRVPTDLPDGDGSPDADFPVGDVDDALRALWEPGGPLMPGPGPEAMEVLEEIVEMQYERTAGVERLPDTVLAVAEELLLLHAEEAPDRLLRTRKPGTWAAGAAHAAFFELDVPAVREDRMTLEELGELFDVSPGSVSRRSRQLRETARDVVLLPFTQDAAAEFLDAAVEAFAEAGDVDDAGLPEAAQEEAVPDDVAGDTSDEPDDDPGDDPPWAVAERALLIGERTGAEAPYHEAADVLEAAAAEMDPDDLEYLLQRGLETAPADPRRRLLAVAVRHFGTEVSSWRPDGAGPWLRGGG